MDLSSIPTNNGIGSRFGWTKIQYMHENVHPNLALVLLSLRTEVKCGKGLFEKKKKTSQVSEDAWRQKINEKQVHKSIVNNTDPQFKTSKPVRVTRRTASSKSVLLDIPKAKTVTFQNSFYSRA